MDRHFEDACGLLAIVVLLPIMLLVVLPATFLFDEHVGLLRSRHHNLRPVEHDALAKVPV